MGMPGAQTGPVPIIRMYGVTMDGHSVLAHVHGFHPHFYVKAPPNFNPQDCIDFKVVILDRLLYTVTHF